MLSESYNREIGSRNYRNDSQVIKLWENIELLKLQIRLILTYTKRYSCVEIKYIKEFLSDNLDYLNTLYIKIADPPNKKTAKKYPNTKDKINTTNELD